MLVNSIDIKEFRGIKNCKKPIKLSKLNFLIGRNNAGKSSLLEALSLLPSPDSNDSVKDISKLKFLLDLHKSENPGNKSLLYFYAGLAEIIYKLEKEEIRIEISENKCDLFDNKGMIKNTPALQSIFNTSRINNLVLYIPFDTLFFEHMEQKIKELKYHINKGGYNVSIAKIINKCIDDKYSEIIFQENVVLRKKISEDNINYVNLRDLGAGAEKVIKIIAITEVLKPKLLLIDDFAAGLHPSLIKIFLEWLGNKEIQIVVSTHSIDVLYQLTNIDKEDINILFLKKSRDDILNCSYLTTDEIEDFLDSNTDPRKLNL